MTSFAFNGSQIKLQHKQIHVHCKFQFNLRLMMVLFKSPSAVHAALKTVNKFIDKINYILWSDRFSKTAVCMFKP